MKHYGNVIMYLISMYNPFRIFLAMTTFLVTGALSSCNHADELEPVSPVPQIVFLFSPSGLGDMSYNDCILEGVQRFKMEHKEIDLYIYSPESLPGPRKSSPTGSNGRKATFRCCLFWVAATMSLW